MRIALAKKTPAGAETEKVRTVLALPCVQLGVRLYPRRRVTPVPHRCRSTKLLAAPVRSGKLYPGLVSALQSKVRGPGS